MTATGAEHTGPLAPLVSALLARAERDAASMLADAQAEADETISRAQEQANSLLAEARSKGLADGEAVVAGARARAERAARRMVLGAERRAHDQARSAARDAVSALRRESGYADIVDALRSRATRELGPEAHVTELDRGGILATSAHRRVNYSFDALADDIVDRLGPEVERIWSP